MYDVPSQFLLRTIRAYWSKCRVVTSSSFSIYYSIENFAWCHRKRHFQFRCIHHRARTSPCSMDTVYIQFKKPWPLLDNALRLSKPFWRVFFRSNRGSRLHEIFPKILPDKKKLVFHWHTNSNTMFLTLRYRFTAGLKFYSCRGKASHISQV